MRRKEIYFILLVIFIQAGCHSNRNASASDISALPVVTGQATLVETGKEIPLSGNIEGFKTVRLGFMVAGRINFSFCRKNYQVGQIWSLGRRCRRGAGTY